MARILSLETSTTVCSVAVHENEELLAMAEVHVEHSHSSRLAGLIDDVAKVAGVALRDINAVAVSSGPGSYTGLRIGTSTAKGLCYALSIPLISIGTLELLAAQMNEVNVMKAWLCPMIDARRMEVYCRLSDAENKIIGGVEAKIIDENSFEEHLADNRIIFFGNGAEKCRSVLTHPNAFFAAGITPSASQMGRIALHKFRNNEIEDLVHFEPYYLKEFRIKRAGNLTEVVPNKIA
jgi:tRNA threonylcarbamoyladenosine biosynthesis protein TsaB